VKKILLILLLTILPIQYAWSMAAVYCGHEQTSEQGTTTHFGHHGHQHQAQADDDTDNGKPAKSKAHGDCEVCHHAVQASVLDDSNVAAPAAGYGYAAPVSPQYLSYIAEGPPRPNWLLVA
jgi:hypothetical protein